MEVVFTTLAWEQFNYWLDADATTATRIRELITALRRDPFNGIGKPEPLKFQLKGYWSRRIDHEHRLVYEISGKKGVDQKCTIIQCRFHYK